MHFERKSLISCCCLPPRTCFGEGAWYMSLGHHFASITAQWISRMVLMASLHGIFTAASKDACHWVCHSHAAAFFRREKEEGKCTGEGGINMLDQQWVEPPYRWMSSFFFCLWINCSFTVVSHIQGASCLLCTVWLLLPADHKRWILSAMCRWAEAYLYGRQKSDFDLQIQFLPSAKLLHADTCALCLSPTKKNLILWTWPPVPWSHFCYLFLPLNRLQKSAVSR